MQYIYICIYVCICVFICTYIYAHKLLHYVGLFCHYAWPYFLTIFGEICIELHNNT